MKSVKVTLKLLEGETCMVRNYRRKPAFWELGEITRVSASFDEKGKPRVSYDVILNRRSTTRSRRYPEGGAPIFLYVSESEVRPIN